jgi:2'-5' RNA ligase
MDAYVRTFVALRLQPSTRRVLHEAAEALKGDDPSLRIPHERDLHVTLQFLGRTAAEDLAPIGDALDEALQEVAPIALSFRGLGGFPNLERPRVIWAGVPEEEGGAALTDLAKTIARALRTVGYRPEKRRFHPHVTIARVHRRPRDAVFEALARSADLDLGGEIVSEAKLILSDPSQRPYHYIDLTTVELGG